MSSFTAKFGRNITTLLAGRKAKQGSGRPWPFEPKNSSFPTHVKGVVINSDAKYSYFEPPKTPGGKGERKEVPGLSLQCAYYTVLPDGTSQEWNGETLTVPYNPTVVPNKKVKSAKGKEYNPYELTLGDFDRLFGQVQGLLDNTMEVTGDNFADGIKLIQQQFEGYEDGQWPEYIVNTEYRTRKDVDGNARVDKHDFIQQAVVVGAEDPEQGAVEGEEEAEAPAEEGEAPAEGEGEAPAEGEGEAPAEEEGEALAEEEEVVAPPPPARKAPAAPAKKPAAAPAKKPAAAPAKKPARR